MSLKASVLNRLKGWRFSGTLDHGEASPKWPCNYWKVCKDKSGIVVLRDPMCGYPREFGVYSGMQNGKDYTFAFEEVSNGVFVVFERA